VVFFQAEDGIRYRNVTGVQTCALPIFASVAFASTPSLQALDARGPITRTLELPVFLVDRRHHFMHSMREDRLPECPSCQCCFCIDAITSSTRCARTDCKNARVASVTCGSTPSLHAFAARGPIASTVELPVLL